MGLIQSHAFPAVRGPCTTAAMGSARGPISSCAPASETILAATARSVSPGWLQSSFPRPSDAAHSSHAQARAPRARRGRTRPPRQTPLTTRQSAQTAAFATNPRDSVLVPTGTAARRASGVREARPARCREPSSLSACRQVSQRVLQPRGVCGYTGLRKGCGPFYALRDTMGRRQALWLCLRCGLQGRGLLVAGVPAWRRPAHWRTGRRGASRVLYPHMCAAGLRHCGWFRFSALPRSPQRAPSS